MNEDVFGGVGVEIEFDSKEDFLKIKETLTRIGVASRKDNTLYQSCHILHKKGRYAILHFKELFILDGKSDTTVIDENDYARRNTIVDLLEQWNLLKVVGPKDPDVPKAPMAEIKVIPYKDKSKWTLCAKYTIGSKK